MGDLHNPPEIHRPDSHYRVTVLNIGTWYLVRRKEAAEGLYNAMMIHQCEGGEARQQNGEDPRQMCIRCTESIPNEIWALWHLLCNDQRRGVLKDG
jgi:hypothetical protein